MRNFTDTNTAKIDSIIVHYSYTLKIGKNGYTAEKEEVREFYLRNKNILLEMQRQVDCPVWIEKHPDIDAYEDALCTSCEELQHELV